MVNLPKAGWFYVIIGKFVVLYLSVLNLEHE